MGYHSGTPDSASLAAQQADGQTDLVTPAARTAAEALAANEAKIARWYSRPSLRILAIGDSHTNGMITPLNGTAVDTVGSMGTYCPLDEMWTASGLAAFYSDNSSIDVRSGSMDPNLSASSSKGSYLGRILPILRRAYPWLGTIRVANVGVNGSSIYSWAGELSRTFAKANANANDGDTFAIGGITYTFRTSVSVAYDVKIGGDGPTTLTNLGYAINNYSSSGTQYGPGGAPNPYVWCPNPTSTSSNFLTFFALVVGTDGNSITAQSNQATRVSAVTIGNAATAGPVAMYNGSATSGLYASTKTALAASTGFGTPDVVIIALGTNDAARRNVGTVPDMAVHLGILVANVHADFPTAKVVLVKPIPGANAVTDYFITNGVLPAINAAVAANPSFASSVNCNSLGRGEGSVTILDAGGVHATIYGYELMAQVAAKGIAMAMGYTP